MSDPVTTVEIEDVLASIRRLVSEGGAAAVAKAVAADHSDALLDNSIRSKNEGLTDKLVLTAALRVVEPVRPSDSARLQDDEVDDASVGSDSPSVGDEVIDLAGRIVDLETALLAQPDEWEPDGSEEEPVMDWSRSVSEDAPVFRSRQLNAYRAERPPEAADMPEKFVVPSFRNAVSQQGLLKGAVIAPHELQNATEFSERDLGNARQEPDLKGLFASGSGIDEAALRKLVVQIVHEELQGPLGERITRNVRKLVRREINRALSGDDLL